MIDRLSDETSQMTFTEVARGKAVTKSLLDSNDGMPLSSLINLLFTEESKPAKLAAKPLKK